MDLKVLEGFKLSETLIGFTKGDIWVARIAPVSFDESVTSTTPVDILSMNLNVRDKLGNSL